MKSRWVWAELEGERESALYLEMNENTTISPLALSHSAKRDVPIKSGAPAVYRSLLHSLPLSELSTATPAAPSSRPSI